MYNEPNGYCVFNNAAVATRHALDVLGLERILLVDWDAHHGQGLQYAFYDDPRCVMQSYLRLNLSESGPDIYHHLQGNLNGSGLQFEVTYC